MTKRSHAGASLTPVAGADVVAVGEVGGDCARVDDERHLAMRLRTRPMTDDDSVCVLVGTRLGALWPFGAAQARRGVNALPC